MSDLQSILLRMQHQACVQIEHLGLDDRDQYMLLQSIDDACAQALVSPTPERIKALHSLVQRSQAYTWEGGYSFSHQLQPKLTLLEDSAPMEPSGDGFPHLTW
jgi:hypothetical protein